MANEGLQRSLTTYTNAVGDCYWGCRSKEYIGILYIYIYYTTRPSCFYHFPPHHPPHIGLRWVDIDRGLGCSEAG